MDALEHNSEKFGLVNLRTLAGVQFALSKVGYDPGAVDGLDGPNTKASVKAFQQAAGIGADGIAGPNTKKALLAALAHASTPEGTAETAMQAAADMVKGALGG
jgi:peptidoglycan hydrolase-like protein with peptidoglycan-binding domain